MGSLKKLASLAYIVISMMGLPMAQLTKLRMLIVGLVMLEICLFDVWFKELQSNYSFVLTYAIVWIIARHAYLYSSFGARGFSHWLIKKYGEEKGYGLYEVGTAFSFWYRSRSFAMLLALTSWQFWPGLQAATHYILLTTPTFSLPILGTLGGQLTALAVVCYTLAALGMVVNIWAFKLIGEGAYYYKDMFLGRFLVNFQATGPYKWFNNPMYSVGQVPSYAMAVMSGSVIGVVFSMANQVGAYVFYYVWEKPHIVRVLAGMQNGTVPDPPMGNVVDGPKATLNPTPIPVLLAPAH
jgi:Phospholipid methyltransferase